MGLILSGKKSEQVAEKQVLTRETRNSTSLTRAERRPTDLLYEAAAVSSGRVEGAGHGSAHPALVRGRSFPECWEPPPQSRAGSLRQYVLRPLEWTWC